MVQIRKELLASPENTPFDKLHPNKYQTQRCKGTHYT